MLATSSNAIQIEHSLCNI